MLGSQLKVAAPEVAPEGCPAALKSAERSCASTARLAVSLLPLCCGLAPLRWPSAAGSNPELPSPTPSAAGGTMCTGSPELTASPQPALSGTDQLKVHPCLFVAPKPSSRRVGAGRAQPPAGCSAVWLLAAAPGTAPRQPLPVCQAPQSVTILLAVSSAD